MAAASEAGPLDGLRVLDLSSQITGPYATKLFVDAGADVVKLESPSGDPLRRWTASGHKLAPGETGALFHYLNAGKRSVVADLGTDAGRALGEKLVDGADLVFESFGPGGAARRGLGWEVVRARNPRCSLVSISPWGLDGPWADRPSTEFTLQAATGSVANRGHPSRGPVAAGGRIGEWIPGVYAAIGALSAWRSARRTGAGQHVDLSVFETLCLSMTIYHDLNSQFFEGPLPQSIETPSIEPAKDGWVGLSTVTGQQWKDFCTLIGEPELSKDERFYDAKARMEHLDFIQGVIWRYTKAHTVDEIIEVMSHARIPVNPLGDGRTLLQMDHLKERRVFIENPAGFAQPRPPYRLSAVKRTAEPTVRPAPELGEHSAELAAELASPGARPEPPEGGGPLPYGGLRVLDLTAFWAGPVATSFLAELGADVIKVESIQRPDFMRFAGSVRNETMWEFNPINHGCNSSKRDITLHVDSEEGMALLKRLIAKADVVVENFSPRVLENWSLDWSSVHALNPSAILVRMPSFGLDGPWRDRVGFAMNIEQVSGLAWLTGYDDIPLVVRGACDPLGGMHAVFALGLALEERRRSGEGQLVEVPLLEPAIGIAAEQVIEQTAYGAFLERSQNRSPAAAPQGVYPCSDPTETGEGPGYVALAVATDAQWDALRRVLGDPPWARDPALASAAGRRAAHDAIDAHLAAWSSVRTRRGAAETLVAGGVPAHECINPHSLFPNPQLEHRGFFQELEHPLVGTLRYPGQPMRFSGLPRQLRRAPAPMLGEHNEQVLRDELGLSDAEIEALREKSVIGTRPKFM
jgi:crotonobetainyl-CoA:carnitine CoA-transferase CaiB-like acyl-CoA transferase